MKKTSGVMGIVSYNNNSGSITFRISKDQIVQYSYVETEESNLLTSRTPIFLKKLARRSHANSQDIKIGNFSGIISDDNEI
jgi:hypothetical protein